MKSFFLDNSLFKNISDSLCELIDKTEITKVETVITLQLLSKIIYYHRGAKICHFPSK